MAVNTDLAHVFAIGSSFFHYLQVSLIHSLSEQTVARMQQPSVNALRYFINYTEALFFQSLSLVRL